MIIVIVGPTAVGKTKLSIELAQKFNAEIICVDSLVVYRDFNIGTAKPSSEERKLVPHHVLDFVAPTELFTAHDFCEAATAAMADVQKRGKNVFLVGGSGLYLKALTHGMFKAPPSDPQIREALEERLSQDPKALYEELCLVDSKTSHAIHPNDHYRILRALEVYQMTKKPFSRYHEEHVPKKRGTEKIVKIGLTLDREVLYRRIEERTARMHRKGLVEEVQDLQKKYPLSCKPFKSVGYKETRQFLNHEITQEELLERINQATRQLAKGQWTWFRADPEIQWFLPTDSQISHKIAELL
ncbi:MAG: tRNA (adenosine(37)-N6)-dimethylallyltransferase MiaA [Deltaproteobacteria bacterium]|nr:tRNA (adenosine(37)-N6)-dimethylallyltransferase MiaA [Deltaproteobacteria bacterium]